MLFLAIATPATAEAPPPFVARAQPGEGQRVLAPLAGTWQVEKSLFVAVGTPDRPAVSKDMTTTREWIGDGRFLQDVTRGTLGGSPYFRTGLLGWDNMEKQYEWTTADNFTPTLMAYVGRAGSTPRQPIDMAGSFVDLGITGEENVGKSIPMRTVIRIESNDRHVFELWFTPPGRAEVLADRMVFTRVK